jgi:signal transduction histidine kinase
MPAFRPTVRLRLTLVYGGLFAAAALVLVVLTYGLLRDALAPPTRPTRQEIRAETREQREDNPDFAAQIRSGERDVDDVIRDIRTEEREAALSAVVSRSSIAFLLTGLAAAFIGWVAAGRVLRPLQAITDHARVASESTLGDRIDLRGPPDELKELADTIDGMLDRLQAAFESQRLFASQASHELRTPLAIMRAEADVALATPDLGDRERALATTFRDQVDRSERLVDGLLALARSESTLRDDARLDLADLAGDIVGLHARDADHSGVEIDLELDAAQVRGDRALLERLVGNLVDNAIKHNQRGGWLKVSVGSEGGEAVLRVANGGAVIPAETVADLFEPFRRGRAARREQRAGYGLGLAIVRSVATVHGGIVTAASPAEGGLVVTVRLPLAAGPLGRGD